MTLFNKNGKGLANLFGQNSWIFKKAYFYIFSCLWPLSIQNVIADHFMKYEKMTLFDKNGLPIFVNIFANIHEFSKRLIFIIHEFSKRLSFHPLDSCLFKICYCRSFHEMWKNDTFWQKWQGVSPCLLAKIHEFSKRLIFISFHPLDHCLFKICHCRSFHDVKKWHFLTKMARG